MGQGLHTKMIQVASQTLNVSKDNIYISETSTDKVPNTTQTAGSISSDINGVAVQVCSQSDEWCSSAGMFTLRLIEAFTQT